MQIMAEFLDISIDHTQNIRVSGLHLVRQHPGSQVTDKLLQAFLSIGCAGGLTDAKAADGRRPAPPSQVGRPSSEVARRGWYR